MMKFSLLVCLPLMSGFCRHRRPNVLVMHNNKNNKFVSWPPLSTDPVVSKSLTMLHETKDNRLSPLGVLANEYFQMMRPVTIIQAVGAIVVGRLALQQSILLNHTTRMTRRSLVLASSSVYLSYGAGMVMNDIVDAGNDALHSDKKSNRPIASGRISRVQGWLFCSLLCTLSLIMAKYTSQESLFFVLWTLSNIIIMLGYALGLQKVFLVKNLLCGLLAVSPLVGATFMDGRNAALMTSSTKLYFLAAAGFPLQVAREILKDAEDVDVDRGSKQTLPLMIGIEPARRLAYTLVFSVIFGMILSPYYWQIFSSKLPIYPLSVLVGFVMCGRATRLSIHQGQEMLKKSIMVLLVGMIGSLLLQ